MYGPPIGFELGPKGLRRAPRGWIPARAISLQHSVYSHNYGPEGGGGPGEIETTMRLKVRWRIEVDGREPYEVQEERSGPAWLAAGGLVGGGNRWYKLRVRPQHGLMKGVPVPCFVNPEDPSDVWIHWDGAYDAHVDAWEREARVQREVARRDGLYDQVWDRVTNPFAGKLRTGEEEIVEARIAKQRPNPPAQGAPAQSGPMTQRIDEITRIHNTGRKTRGMVVAHAATERRFENVPVFMITFEIEGRHVVFEHVFGPRHAKHYKVGREVDVWVDPADPNAICPGR